MVIVYLDIETFNESGNISIEDKVIAIGCILEKNNLRERYFWKEWELGEEEIIKEFYSFLKELTKKERTVWIIGFNILRFDIPFLICKALKYNVNEKEVFEIWHKCFIEDERQILLPLNGFIFSGLSAENVLKALKEVFSEIDEKTDIHKLVIQHSGSDVAHFYKTGDYDEILDHLSSDLEFLAELHHLLVSDFEKLVSIKEKFKDALRKRRRDI